MGIYRRKDSPYWWMHLEITGAKTSTGIPHTGTHAEQTKDLRKQAETIYRRRLGELALLPSSPRLPVISWTAYSAWYEQHHAAHLRGVVRVSSMLRQLAEFFGRVDSLAQITESMIREWMTWRKAQVSASTVNRELDVLKSLLHTAVPRYLAHSPASEVRRLRVVEQERRILTRDEEARLLAVGNLHDRAWIILSIDSLLRLSNTVGLQWAQVKRDVIVPLNAKVSLASVPISSRLRAALDALEGNRKGYVFPAFHEDGDGPQAPKQRAIRRFARLCALADVKHGGVVGGVTIHCLRHTGATRALQAGASVATVMKLGGWKDERMVLRYVHATDEDVRRAAESIGGIT